MSVAGRKKECCGTSFRRPDIPVLGLLTASVPAVALSGALLSLALPLGWVSGRMMRLVRPLRIVLQSNLRLISQSSIFPAARTSLSARLLGLAPSLAAGVYDHFNLALLLAIWAGMVLGVMALV